VSIAILFTDLVGFSAWALKAGDAAMLELLREVGTAQEAAGLARGGRIVKRLGDGLMSTSPRACATPPRRDSGSCSTRPSSASRRTASRSAGASP
jgi:class 3 adenylate cyclase